MFLGVGLLLVLVFRLDPDPHHDGYMFTAARAVSTGLNIHGEVFYQYGPFTAWVHGYTLHIFGEKLIVLRLVSVAAILLALALSFHAARKVYSPAVAFIGATLWLGLASFFSREFPPLAWSSDVALAVQALVLFLITRRGWTKWLSSQGTLVTTGALLVILLLTRLSTGVLSLVAVLVVLILGPHRRRSVLSLLGGSTCLLALVALVLTVSGSIGEWWKQTVVIPRHIYLSSLGEFGKSSVGSSILAKGLPLLGLFVCAATGFAVAAQVEDRWKRIGLELTGILTTGLVLWITYRAGDNSILSREALLWVLLLAVPLVVTQSELFLSIRSRDYSGVLFVALSIASLIQVFPIADQRHLWWSIFPGVYPVTNLLLNNFRTIFGRIIVGLIVGLTVASGISGFFEVMRVPRYELSSPVFDGMLAKKDLTLSLRDDLDLMRDMEQVHGPRPSLNLCVDGLYAGLSSEIAFPDPYFVDGWDFPSEVHNENSRSEFVRQRQPFIWLCPPVVQPSVEEDAPTTSEILQPLGYRLVERRKCLREDPYFNEWPRLVYLAVPAGWPPLSREIALSTTETCGITDGN